MAEVIVRAVLTHTGEDRNGGITGYDALRDAVKYGLFKGVPCYLGHGAPKQSHRAQGRFRLGRWHGIKFDHDTGHVIGYMHTRYWLPIFERMGFSVADFVRGTERIGRVIIPNVYQVYSVDLVHEPACPLSRPQQVTVLNSAPPPPLIARRLWRIVNQQVFSTGHILN